MFKLMIKKELKSAYPSAISLLLGFVSIFIMSLVYWYTSKAITPNSSMFEFKGNYFEFVIFAELALILPTTFILESIRITRELSQNGILLYLFNDHKLLRNFILTNTLAAGVIEAIKFFFLLLIIIFVFQLQLSGELIKQLFLSQLLLSPSIIGISLMGVSFVFLLGRGGQVVPMLLLVLTVLAGAYFPIGVFPDVVQQFTKNLSPLSLLLNIMRGKEISLTTVMILNILYLSLGVSLFSSSIKIIRKQGRLPFLIR